MNSLADLEARGVAFVSVRDNVDLTTPSGRLMVQIIGAMAEFEQSLIEQVRAGMRNSRSKGKQIGRPPLTQLKGDTRRSIYETHKAGGKSLRQLAVKFSTSVASVQRSIRAYQRAGEWTLLTVTFSSQNSLLPARNKGTVLILRHSSCARGTGHSANIPS